MKRTSERGWSGRPWTSRFRKNRDVASQGHPLDPLNYNSERQLIFSKKRSEYILSLRIPQEFCFETIIDNTLQHSIRDEHIGQIGPLLVVTEENHTILGVAIVVVETQTTPFIVETIEIYNQNWIRIYKHISQNHPILRKDNQMMKLMFI